jgi:hypothetical protein
MGTSTPSTHIEVWEILHLVAKRQSKAKAVVSLSGATHLNWRLRGAIMETLFSLDGRGAEVRNPLEFRFGYDEP